MDRGKLVEAIRVLGNLHQCLVESLGQIDELKVLVGRLLNETQPMLVERQVNPWRCMFARKPEVMDAADVARTLGMKTSTFMKQWRDAGFPMPHHVGSAGRGRKHYWRRDDVVEYLIVNSSNGNVPAILPDWEVRRK